jgi:hypothetical protein
MTAPDADVRRLTAKLQRYGRMWRIYLDGVGLQTYYEGLRSGPLPERLIIGPYFWRAAEWEHLPVSLWVFIMSIALKYQRISRNDFQEIRVTADGEVTEIWVKFVRVHVVEDDDAEYLLGLVSSMLGAEIELQTE